MAETTLARVGRMWLTFLGTAGAGGCSRTRSGSATSLSFETSDGVQNWLVNCGEGTRRQLFRTHHPSVKSRSIRRVFVSQLDMDHCMGILPVMSSVMDIYTVRKRQSELLLEFYGPKGLRRFIHESIRLNRMHVGGKYAVHELQLEGKDDTAYWENIMYTSTDKTRAESPKKGDKHPNEILGRNLLCKPTDGKLWLDIVPESQHIRVDAGLGLTTDGGLGFVFTERDAPTDRTPRKVAILGCAEYSSHMKEISMDATAMVHGMRYARISPELANFEKGVYVPLLEEVKRPSEDDPGATKVNTSESPSLDATDLDSVVTDSNDLHGVREPDLRTPDVQTSVPPAEIAEPSMPLFELLEQGDKTLHNDPRPGSRPNFTRRSYVTPGIVGEFARSARAQQLYLNHFIPRFPQALPPTRRSVLRDKVSPNEPIISEIERQATETFKGPWVTAAYDLLVVPVLPVELDAPVDAPVGASEDT